MRQWWIAGLAVSVLCTLGVVPASASFAGRNGKILLVVLPPPGDQTRLPLGPVHFWTVEARSGAVAHDIGVAAGDYEEFRGAEFTPNGRQILYLHALRKPVDVDALLSLDLMNAGGGGRRVVVQRHGIASFAISPDGKRIAYVALDEEGHQTLYMKRLDTGHTRMVFRDSPWSGGPFQWAGDGRMYAAESIRCTARFFCAFNPSTGSFKTIHLLSRRVEIYGYPPAISPDGARLAFYDPTGPAGVRVYGMDGRFRRNIVGPDLCPGPFSPNGQKLLLADSCGGTNVRLSEFNFATNQIEPLDVSVPIADGATDAVVDWQAIPRAH